MALRVTLTHKHKQMSGLKLLQDRLTERTAGTLADVAQYALQTAAEHTPKWSGNATEGWRISFTPRGGYTNAYGPDMADPKYPGGIGDSAADELNRMVVARQMKALRSRLKGALRRGRLAFYLVNDADYSRMWLDGGSAGSVLRAVNQDYYTVEDIKNAVQMYRTGLRFGGWV